MKRMFLPVGQGAFYVEFFDENLIYVYDCGTSTDIKILKDEINNIFKEDQVIEGVFISHLHEDHVNGLEYLLKRCNVRNVYFPYLTPIEIILTYINCLCNQKMLSPFIRDIFEYKYMNITKINEKNKTNVILITPEKIMSNDILENYNNISYIRSGLEISVPNKTSGNNDWIYITFNFMNKLRAEIFFNKLNNEGIDRNEIENITAFKEKWNDLDFRKKIIKAYKSLGNDLNINSLVVYSGPKDIASTLRCFVHNVNNAYFEHPNIVYGSYNHNSGCLYLGDYDASVKNMWKELINHNNISKYLMNIGTIQIPHHGSKYNYNTEMSNLNSMFIISAGQNNKHRHPHKEVVHDIQAKKRRLFIVSEVKTSAACFIIN
jgi:ribonuclease BN (tRNA processing enzyme)